MMLGLEMIFFDIFFFFVEYLNYFGMDERFGFVALFLKREKFDESIFLLNIGEVEGNIY